MLNQFSRTELLFGSEAITRLQNAHVAVFGIGGVGGYTVEALARSGVGSLTSLITIPLLSPISTVRLSLPLILSASLRLKSWPNVLRVSTPMPK